MTTASPQTITAIPVYLSGVMQVVHGVNEGDGLSFAEELVPDDIYWFAPAATQVRLSIESRDDGTTTVSAQTGHGTPGARLVLDSCLTFMSPDGATSDVLVIVEVGQDGAVNDVYALPLAPMIPRTDYQLVGIDTRTAHRKLADVACVSFTRGTLITLASGRQCPIEDLSVGDRVLTRDDGAQQIRWIGTSIVRATGAFAPIVIRAGALANANDLVVSPDHRLFIYQRVDALDVGRKEVLVRARHLINDDTVFRQEGGFVEYFQLLFDTHQIIYAEGIAAETLLLDDNTRTALGPQLPGAFLGPMSGHSDRPHLEYELSAATLRRPDALEILRGVSRRPPPSRD
ncbi:hypothetical protein DL237_07840 [Pseudooceanicola sediminis]|uniref:Hint domain-containing protein n=1 Tax=Pseudooceanicola sediminis TaxID=2211117 RepID=A0A399J1C2_9RHOB|nr:Hint domain-containing protein [Pseudooceanicola sediminis]KAA2316155.1 Hint domain-containing protein [Puniceibacterium sp. HSS470]RII39070.1 hypothetical protein DL237_07840 [Pseudooceanicola sediminis]|tara:strand:- start:117683 stop:118714 length:1032 start_codon:yes stop_codon:yes gene_type:complete